MQWCQGRAFKRSVSLIHGSYITYELDISFSEGVLSVIGEKTKEVSIDESCYCSERYTGSFQRSFRIPGLVDKENIKAKYRDGILRVSLTKSEESVVKKIEIH